MQWTVILFAAAVLFYLLKLTIPSTQDITKRLDDCLQAKITNGQYVSDEDGKSAEALLNQCPTEVDRWTERCQLDSKEDDRTTCAVKVIVLTQEDIKKIDK